MKLLFTIAAAGLGLAACTQGGADNNAAMDNMTLDAGTNDPATTDLQMNSSASETDQAINATDNQSEIGNAADDATNTVSNSVH